MADLVTPFRQRYERSLRLGPQAQLEECADYLQHPEVLTSEFLEAYYAVEHKLDPAREDRRREASLGMISLESSHLAARRSIGDAQVVWMRSAGGGWRSAPVICKPAGDPP